MNAPAPYLHWGFILISLPNLILIAVMVAVFVAALVVPFPHHGSHHGPDDHD
jgi:ABC-type polysaccharide/polyol phosphate export permease